MSAIEMGWRRRILGVSTLQRLRNESIRSKLGQDETLCSKIQNKRLRWFGHMEIMEEHRLPCTYISITLQHRGQENQRKTSKELDGQHKRRFEKKEFEH